MTTQSDRPGEILVLGATGKTGRRVARRLRAAGARVRAASRSGEVRFDWFGPETWTPALTGATSAYVVAPDDPAPVRDFVRLASSSGVSRFIVLSGRSADRFGTDFGEGMLAAEAAVRATDAEWTIIRPNNFNQNFDEDLWLKPLREGRLALPIGDTPEPFIDAEDVAEVAVTLLTEPGHAGRTYELSGPRALTFREAVETIARAAGRPIRYEELTPEDYHAELLADGYPEAAATALNAMFALHRAGHTAAPTPDARQVLARAPVDFTNYATRAAATWS